MRYEKKRRAKWWTILKRMKHWMCACSRPCLRNAAGSSAASRAHWHHKRWNINLPKLRKWNHTNEILQFITKLKQKLFLEPNGSKEREFAHTQFKRAELVAILLDSRLFWSLNLRADSVCWSLSSGDHSTTARRTKSKENSQTKAQGAAFSNCDHIASRDAYCIKSKNFSRSAL